MFLSFSRLGFFIIGLFSLGLAACEKVNPQQEQAPESISEIFTEILDPGCLGEDCRFQEIVVKERFGYDLILDTETFRFSQPPSKESYQLTEKDLKKLSEWRSPKGVPWTAWVYEADLSFESHEAFSIRSITGAYFISDRVMEKVIRFLIQEAGMEPADELFEFVTYRGLPPDNLEAKAPEELNYILSRWFQENVAASSFEIYTGISETYAWYTSPSYQEGTLPTEIEEAMELMKRGELPETPWDAPELIEVANRAAEIVRTEITPSLEGPFYASNFDLMFLQMGDTLSALGFYQELLDFLEVFINDPLSFSKIQPQFVSLLETAPRPTSDYLFSWAERVLPDLLLLEETKGLTPGKNVNTTRHGEIPVFAFRAFVTTEVELLTGEVGAFIRKWSELNPTS